MLNADPTDYSTPPLESTLESENEEGTAGDEENGDGGSDSGANEGVVGPEGAEDNVTNPGDQEAGAGAGDSTVGLATATQEVGAMSEAVRLPEDDVVMADGTTTPLE